jgi:hypothetical protein
MSVPARVLLAAALACALPACVPIPMKGDVSAASTPVLTSLAEPLDASEGIVILGRTTADDGIADCVRNALAKASPHTRIAAGDVFRAASGSAPAKPDGPVDDNAVETVLREAAVQRSVGEHAIRYVFFIEGKTEDINFTSTGTMGVGAGSSDRTTTIAATVWEAPSVRRIGQFTASASGHPNMLLIALILFYEYAPTEGTSCARMAGDIQHFLASGYTPPVESQPSAPLGQAEEPTMAPELEPAAAAAADSSQSTTNGCQWAAEKSHWQCW